ncbi:MAG: efflux RND transporter permease subunit [Rhodospirillaceae bacterium]|nr:efflux RND transporter permease subunit [Rhodospirillaceae bacterium]MBT6960147.1 efflux RND transporter permease subunit [Rhodospirillaceae bacterium]
MNMLIALAARRAKIIFSAFAVLIISGVTAYVNVPRESLPQLAITVIYTSVMLEGVSPDDSERLLVRPLEEELQNLEGLKELRATAYQGGANVVLEFDAGVSEQSALQDVRAAVDRAKPELPEEALEPTISQVDFTRRPVLTVALSGDLPERTLLSLARELRDEVRQIPSVLDATVSGAREEQVEIIIDPLLVEYYGLNKDELFRIFSRSNRLVAAGNLDTGNGRFAVTVPGLFETSQDIFDLPIKSTDDAVVTLGDIADIRRTFKDRKTFVRINGKSAVTVDISRRPEANVVGTIISAREVVDGMRPTWPEGLNVSFPVDDTENITSRFDSLQNSVISAVIIVMAICMAFLGFRSGLLVGIAIPGSFLTGILVLATLGITLNALALIGLILSVGILVDGAIVVVENAESLKEEGVSSKDAYVRAAQRMAWPITSSTATTLVVFLPLLFWPGNTGAFFKYLPITLISVLTAALVMALIFVPAIGASLKSKSSSRTRTAEKTSTVSLTYSKLLNKCVDNPGKVILATIMTLIFVQVGYSNYGKGVYFFPPQEPDSATLSIHARGNLSLSEQDRLVEEVENQVLGLDGIKFIYTKTGRPPGAGADAPAPDFIGDIKVEMLPWNSRRPALEILGDIQSRVSTLPGIEVLIKKEGHGPTLGQAIQIEVASKDSASLQTVVELVRQGMSEVGGFTSKSDNRPLPGIEWQLQVDRSEASKYNADVTVIGQSIQLITNGLKLGEYRPDDSEEELDIVVRYPEELRSIRSLDQVRIETGRDPVPISNFVDRVPVQQAGEIARVDGIRTMKVTADPMPGYFAGLQVERLKQWLAGQDIPENVTVNFKGEEADSEASSSFLTNAFLLAIFMMGIILLAQFNSFYSVFVVLTAVLLSTSGVFLGLLVTGSSFSIVMSGIGTIALAGIVVNNNIVLIDTFNQFNDGVRSLRDAVIKTGEDRLRPVLLTTGTTVLGLLPTATQFNVDFFNRTVTIGDPATEWWAYMSQAIIYGLLFATALTLIVTPCMLMAREKFSLWKGDRILALSRLLGRKKGEETGPVPPLPAE